MFQYRTNVDYYLRELEWLRVEGAAFAKRYPNIASRLDIGLAESADPHVERLIESVAFLTGRVNRNIEEDFTEIPLALLTILSPHLSEPIPSMTILSFQPEGVALPPEISIPNGSKFQTDLWYGTPCFFTTCMPLSLYLLTTETVRMQPRFRAIDSLRIRVRGPANYLSKAKINELRFFFGGDPVRASTIYDYMSRYLSGIVLTGQNPDDTVFLSSKDLHFNGFTEEESLLPLHDTSMPSHRLLLEYFAFPEKFQFITVSGIDRRPPGDYFDIHFLFNSPLPTHGEGWKDTFRLNCVTAINLYKAQASPFFLDGRQYEHRLIADTARQRTIEVHSIQSIELHFPGTPRPVPIQPYFSFQHNPGDEEAVYWWVRRVPVPQVDATGIETLINFVGLDFARIGVRRQFVTSQILCSNRDIVQRLDAGSILSPFENLGGWQAILFSRPSIYRPCLTSGDLIWRLTSHLGANYVAFIDSTKGLDALKDFIRLMTVGSHATVRQRLNGLLNLRSYETVKRASVDKWRGFRPHTKVEIEIDQAAFVGTSIMLFEQILNVLFEDGRGINKGCDIEFIYKSSISSPSTIMF